MEHTPLQLSVSSLSKQLLKFRTRITAGIKGDLRIHAKIVYFNAFSLSLFYCVQTHRYFALSLLRPLYDRLAFRPSAIMHAVSLFGCFLETRASNAPQSSTVQTTRTQKQVLLCWRHWQQQLAPDETQQLLSILGQSNTSARVEALCVQVLHKSPWSS